MSKEPPMKIPDRFVTSKTFQEIVEVSESHLNRCVEQGIFQLGVHYLQIENPNARRPTRRWNPRRIVEVWATDPATRPACPPRSKR